MPLYEYICANCKQIETIRCAYAEADMVYNCTNCGTKMKRIVSAIARTPNKWT